MKVDVRDPVTDERLFSCVGPDAFGACPRASADGLPCTGRRLEVAEPARLHGLRLAVTGHGPACPLRALMPGTL